MVPRCVLVIELAPAKARHAKRGEFEHAWTATQSKTLPQSRGFWRLAKPQFEYMHSMRTTSVLSSYSKTNLGFSFSVAGNGYMVRRQRAGLTAGMKSGGKLLDRLETQ